MEIPIEKVAPRAIVLAIVAYCVWPSLSALTSQPEVQKPKEAPELTAAMLSPSLPSVPTHDPFGGMAVPPWARAVTSEPPSTGSTTKENTPDRSPAKAGETVETADIAKGMSPGKHAEPLPTLSLKGTYIAGQQRLAVINDHIYRQQDPLQLPDASAPKYVVSEIHSDRVLLKSPDKTVELKYSNPNILNGP